MKKLTAILCAMALALSLCACGGTTSQGTGEGETSATSETAAESSTVTGKVTAVSGTTVTVALGSTEQPSGDNAGNGQQPSGEAPSGDSSAASDSQPPEIPSGDNAGNGQQPSGEAPSGDSSAASDSQPPEMPSGDNAGNGQQPSGEAPSGDSSAASDSQPPELPSGDSSSSDMTMPENGGAAGGFTESGETAEYDLSGVTVTKEGDTETEYTVEDIAEGDLLRIELDSDGNPTAVTIQSGDMGGGQSFGGSGEVTQGTAASTIDEDGTYTSESYTSTGDDENALRVDGATVSLENIVVEKTAGSSSNTEDGDFYGMNAALLATNGAQVSISGASVTSSAQNGNGVFSYGEGTVVNISDSEITTTADNSGGIQTTGGGTTNASNLTITTGGNSSAAIRSDRGGGTVNVEGGTYTTNGVNSPAVYSTADITVADAELTATNSEALVIEGQNSIALTNCTVSGNMDAENSASADENVHNVMIYQSMSGDAEVGKATFSMTGGSLTGTSGDLFYVTNTQCDITLSGVELSNGDEDGVLLRVAGNSASHGWGTAGANGGQVTLNADSQTLEGDIVVDSISTLSLNLTNGSTLTGTITITENAEGGAAVEDNAVVTLDEGCTWNLTGDCTITSLSGEGTVNYNGYTITLADGTVLSE